ncbi:Uncharacterized protein GmHk_03G006633 [Glycine max]|nr:Uncharacterized protein GmHk_03G006633 [Glycine max]
MAMSVARLKKDEIQRLKKAIDSLRCPTVELHESETSATAEEPPRRERKNGDIPRDERNNTTITIAVPALLVFSGGIAFNGVVEELKNFTTRVAHVLLVSEDGGSTTKIVSVLVFLHLGIFVEPNFGGEELGILSDWVRACVAGGPAVGDIRSRCLRLSDQSTIEALAVRNLLGHRLPLDPLQAKSKWLVPHS